MIKQELIEMGRNPKAFTTSVHNGVTEFLTDGIIEDGKMIIVNKEMTQMGTAREEEMTFGYLPNKFPKMY